MSKFTSIATVSDWFFVAFPVDALPNSKLIVWRLAAWAISEEGNAIGLISVHGGGDDDNVMGRTYRLIAPPPLRGVYKHVTELDEDERAAVRERKRVVSDEECPLV